MKSKFKISLVKLDGKLRENLSIFEIYQIVEVNKILTIDFVDKIYTFIKQTG